jgi:HemY protein
MIRIVIFLALASLLALGAAWLADRPGEISVTWLGWQIETSIMVAVVALMLVVVLAVLSWSLLRAVWRSPHSLRNFVRRRRGARGDLAISRGLIAVGAGDLRSARKYAGEAFRLKSGEPLALLLNAQAAQLAGDRPAADQAFRAMAERNDTKLLGLRGLFVEARRREDFSAARNFAEEAARTAPNLAWAGQAALEFRCAAGDWDGALDALERNYKNRLLDKPAYRRQRAVLLVALALEESDRDRARQHALEAVKLAPTLVPAAELAGRMLIEQRKQRRASKIIEKAWQANPHPDLAQVYAYLRIGDSARDRLARVQSLAEMVPGHVEGAIAVARAAIDAHEFTVVRTALRPLLEQPTQRVAELMAELEQTESGHEGRAREWMARALRAPRDAAWTADGFVSERWLPVSPVSGRIDAVQWKAPMAAIAGNGASLDGHERAPMLDSTLSQAIPPAELEGDDHVAPSAQTDQGPPFALPPQATNAARRLNVTQTDQTASRTGESAARSAANSTPKSTAMIRRSDAISPEEKPVAPVIPLVHAPDDPGPDPTAEPEIRSEPPADTSWWRIRLFK